MPWMEDDDSHSADARVGVYQALLEAEEHNHEKRGGRPTLVDDDVVISKKPSPALAALRAGRPVTVDEFQVPPRFRDYEPLRGVRLRVLPNDRIDAVSYRGERIE